MAWNTTEDVEEYLAAAGDFLRSRPVAHTVLLTVAAGLSTVRGQAGGPCAPVFGWWHTSRIGVTGTFLQTPPRRALLSDMPAAAVAALPEALAGTGRTPPGVIAGAKVAEAFTAAWRRHSGSVPRIRMRQRLYRLDTLTPPRPAPPGGPRIAKAADNELLIAWYEAFATEVHGAGGADAEVIDDRLGYGGLTVWEADGIPVSLAGRTRMVAEMVRVAPVYTPPERRRRGFAAAVTAAVSREALDLGARDVVLFTDLDNPTSNEIYQRIGYRPVEDHITLSFDPDGA